jgi:putative ABC transport system substrate-binding protein
VQSLLTKNIDAFFALPDNVVFASMEVIVSSCDKSKVPIFTSEEGLVKRGAIAAFGADMYQWGHQSGMLAATYLKDESGKKPLPEIVKVRRRVYNEEKAEMFNVQFGGRFEKVK